MKRVLIVAAAAGLFWAPAGARQQTPTQFRSGVQTVPVYVSVADGSGGFLHNLKQEEFEIRDEGKVQTITQFTTDAQPLSVVILIDGSSSMWDVFNNVLESANSFIVRMLKDDRTAIASFSDRFHLRQGFTSDRDVLLAHLKDEFNIRMGVESRVWESLEDAILAVEKEKGRRIVLILSDGKQWSEAPGGGFISPRTVLAHAMIKDVMIYAIPMWTRWKGLDEAPSAGIARLAAQTGGGSFEVRDGDNIAAVFTQVALDMHQQYLLGFTPQVLDGKTHKIEVRVKRPIPGLKVRARPSYVAPAQPPKQPGT